MNDFYLQAFNALSGAEFEEKPVTIEEFVQSEEFLNLPPLSEHQYTIVRAMSQIYKEETLISLYGEEAGRARFQETCNEIVLPLGKGSGKDFTSTIACAYIVYLLLCLKNPAKYYGKPSGDTIDIINIAINADQAQRVFFKNFKTRVERCPWFDDKMDPPKNNMIEFDKNINVYSGHSEREAFEGYNTLVIILDEISGFALESTSGLDQAKTAPAIYNMYRASVTSRFPEFGKLVLLSFPRFAGDFIMQRYEAVIAGKEVVMKEHTFKRDPHLPDQTEGNEFSIKWEEDHIIRYKHPRMFALRRPTWEVNPLVKITDYTRDFDDNMEDTLGRVACNPTSSSGGFIKNKEAIEAAFVARNGVDEDGIYYEGFQPKEMTTYYMHVDLARKHDHCAVAMAHIEDWRSVKIAENYEEVLPFVVVDAVRWWTPTKQKSVDFNEVRDFILSVRRRGFDIRLVTFDRWDSADMINTLKANGLESDNLSVAKKHYDDFLMTMYENRLRGPKIDLLTEELAELKLIKGKVDHPRKGSKDLADAVCGAIYNAVAHTVRDTGPAEVEIKTYDDIRRQAREEAQAADTRTGGVIRPPKNLTGPRVQEFFDRYHRDKNAS